MKTYTIIAQAFIDIEDFNASLRCGRKAYKLLKSEKEEDKETIKFLLIAGMFMIKRRLSTLGGGGYFGCSILIRSIFFLQRIN